MFVARPSGVDDHLQHHRALPLGLAGVFGILRLRAVQAARIADAAGARAECAAAGAAAGTRPETAAAPAANAACHSPLPIPPPPPGPPEEVSIAASGSP